MNIAEIEKDLLNKEQTELDVIHTFGGGVYVRELHIPKGTIVVGKRHRKKTINMLIKGKMTIYDENSSFEVEAPFIKESLEFTKKAGIAHEDSIWINVHPTDSTDLEEIENEFIINEDEYKQLIKKDTKCLG